MDRKFDIIIPLFDFFRRSSSLVTGVFGRDVLSLSTPRETVFDERTKAIPDIKSWQRRVASALYSDEKY